MLIKLKSFIPVAIMIFFTSMLSACHEVALLNPKGAIGKSERELILIALILMLIVVIPSIIMTLVFAWKYRESNTQATYLPDWCHSYKIEFWIWGIPIIIIVILAVLTWKGTHKLDPYQPILLDNAPPMTVEVVALNWKWLFIYPQEQIATVNALYIPTGVPIDFKVTADAPMNSFMIPQLGGQIYAMGGMQTHLHLISNHNGVYDGRGVSFSGGGFSGMTFKVHSLSKADYQEWSQQIHSSGLGTLDLNQYQQLSLPSTYQKPLFFASVSPDLYSKILMQFMDAASALPNANHGAAITKRVRITPTSPSTSSDLQRAS